MSSGVELKVTLVGGDDTENDIMGGRTPEPPISQPAQVQAPAGRVDDTQPEPTKPAQQIPFLTREEAARQKADSKPEEPTGRKRDEQGEPSGTEAKPSGTPSESVGDVRPEKAIIDSMDKLAKFIEKLIDRDATKGSRPTSTAGDTSKPSAQDARSTTQRIVDAISEGWNKSDFAKTRSGKAIAKVASRGRKLGARVVSALERTRIGRRAVGTLRTAAKGVIGRMAKTRIGQTVATRAAGSAASAAAGAGASGAAAGSAGAGGVAAGAAVAGPLIAVAAAAAGAALTLKAMHDAVSNATRELEEYSPAIAMVRSQMQVTRELQQLDRAGRTGAGLAQIEAAKGRIQESMYEVQTKILEVILKFAPFLEALLDTANAGVRGVDAVIANVENGIAMLTPDPTDDQPAQARADASNAALIQALRDIFQDNNMPPNGMDPWVAQLFTIPGGRGRGPGPMPPPRGFP